MKIGYFTGDIQPNGHFSFFHDLLTNYPGKHRIYLVNPNWDRGLVRILKEKGIEVQAIFEDFQPDTDTFWNKIYQHSLDCDVLISANITNLDEILPEHIEKPIVSVSLAQQGYKLPNGLYGSFWKKRFHKVAVSQAAIESFPQGARNNVKVIHSGVCPKRLTTQISRDKLRADWFGKEADNVKLIMFTGSHQESKGLQRIVEALDYLPANYYLIILNSPPDLIVPEHLSKRVKNCAPTYIVADIFEACDVFVLPTEHEGMSMALLEAWWLEVPTVTTRHSTIKELQAKHEGIEFGKLIDIIHSPKELAEAIEEALAEGLPDGVSKCVAENYTADQMVNRWEAYLNSIVES